jgi:hypothetical protein
MLAGFLGRKSDGHPGPDLIGHGLILLNFLVEWEELKKGVAPHRRSAKNARRRPG